jgi:hypothetical protein
MEQIFLSPVKNMKNSQRIRENRFTKKWNLFHEFYTSKIFFFSFRAATVHIPKPPPETTAKAIQKRRDLRKKRVAEVNIGNIFFSLYFRRL